MQKVEELLQELAAEPLPPHPGRTKERAFLASHFPQLAQKITGSI
jgi:hypothetical protein